MCSGEADVPLATLGRSRAWFGAAAQMLARSCRAPAPLGRGRPHRRCGAKPSGLDHVRSLQRRESAAIWRRRSLPRRQVVRSLGHADKRHGRAPAILATRNGTATTPTERPARISGSDEINCLAALVSGRLHHHVDKAKPRQARGAL